MRPGSHPHALPRHERLRRGGDFQAVFQDGKRIERRPFVVLWRPVAGERKIGFTVSRQVRGSVARNRARRRLREAYRRHRDLLPPRIAVVFVGRALVLTAPFEVLKQEMIDVARLLCAAALPAVDGQPAPVRR
jgi:ribonuclease P protein component